MKKRLLIVDDDLSILKLLNFILSKDYEIVRSQYLSANQRDALKRIKTSPLVQIVASRTDRTTVLVDVDSFKVYDEQDDTFTISFKINLTNEVPSQRV